MHLTDKITIASTDEDAGTCTLALAGETLPGHFNGLVIEGQYQCALQRYLLCLSMGTSYDDEFTLYLLDHNGSTLDAITGGGLLSTGVFKAIACAEDSLDFTCFSDTVSRLQISAQPRLHVLSPAPWRYSNLLSRHYLSLKELPPGAQHD